MRYAEPRKPVNMTNTDVATLNFHSSITQTYKEGNVS